jgi:excisionase family DNA binding protein
METLLSPREVADALGVSESSVKRWVDGGELAAQRTAGGHRRIARSEALRFARSKCVLPARPEMLAFVGVKIEDSALGEVERAAAFHSSLLADDRPRSLSLLTSAFLAGSPIASLCDGPIRFALEAIGETWMHDPKGILVEHRAIDLCLHALGVLRASLPIPAADAPVAVGSAGPEDPYLLPGLMCAAVLAELGFRDVNLGPRTPVATKIAAARSYGPLLVWHTASIGGDEIAEIATALRSDPATAGARLVCGGRAAPAAALPSGVVALSSMRELQAFARALLPATGN